jgi:hypothetical protein
MDTRICLDETTSVIELGPFPMRDSDISAVYLSSSVAIELSCCS